MPEERRRYIPPFLDVNSPRLKGEEIEVKERIENFKEVELGLKEVEAKKEADRCLSCRRCLGCALCAYECKDGAVDFEMKEEFLDLNVDVIVVTPEVKRASRGFDSKWGYGKYLNVFSETQFERILSPTGPYDGSILKPSDGDIPNKVAFISTNKEDNPLRMQYLKKLIILAKEKLKNLEAHIFIGNKESFKDMESSLIIRDEIENIVEREDKNIEITWKDGTDSKKEVFDLIVLLGEPEFSPFLKEVFQDLNINVRNNSWGCKKDFSLVTTSNSGIFLAGNLEEVDKKS